MTPDPSDDYLSDHFFYQSEYLSLETYLSMFDRFLFGEKVMKISRNELRRMILESILNGSRNDFLIDKQLVEQANTARRSEELLALYSVYNKSPKKNINALVELLKQDNSENKKDFFVNKDAYEAFMSKVNGLEAALKKEEDTKGQASAKEAPRPPAKTNTAEKKKKNRRYTKSNQWINR